MVKFEVEVKTYNLLSDQLAAKTPHLHPGCKLADLAFLPRVDKVILELKSDVENKRIICLQEVDEIWARILLPFFKELGYATLNQTGDKVGILMAYPIDVIRCVESSIVCPAQEIAEKIVPHIKPVTACVKFQYRVLRFALRSCAGRSAARIMAMVDQLDLTYKGDHWNRATYSKNLYLIMAKFVHITDNKVSSPSPSPSSSSSSSSKEEFVVSTSHLPCAFNDPFTMRAHITMSRQLIKSFANGIRTIYCGDFNIIKKQKI